MLIQNVITIYHQTWCNTSENLNVHEPPTLWEHEILQCRYFTCVNSTNWTTLSQN